MEDGFMYKYEIIRKETHSIRYFLKANQQSVSFMKMHSYSVALLIFGLFGTSLAITVHQFAELHQQAPIHHYTTPIPILKLEHEQSKQGYKFSYQTGNGIHAQELGYIKNSGDKKNEVLVQHGSVTYHDEHGHPITLTYVADEHGFQPKGAHLPTPPPIPLEHQHAVEEQHVELPLQESYGNENFDHAEYTASLN